MTTPAALSLDPIEAAIQALVDEAPPLTPGQIARLQTLFAPAREDLARRRPPRHTTNAA